MSVGLEALDADISLTKLLPHDENTFEEGESNSTAMEFDSKLNEAHRKTWDQTDLRRFQMMIRVPVFVEDMGELMKSISRKSSSCVLKGEKVRMSARLALFSSFTLSKAEC